MFQPQYTITQTLLSRIKHIAVLVEELNSQRFPKVVLMNFERRAQEVSSFASTSIEGNPLPLTEVKKILKNKPVYIRDSEREVLNYNELFDEIDFTAWLEYLTEGIIDELLRVKKLLSQTSYSPKTKLEKYHLAVPDSIKQNGFITNRDYAKLTQRAKATRALDFQKLMEMGLIERKGKGRSTYYVLRENQ